MEKLVCEYCQKKLQTKYTLKNHVLKKHPENDLPEIAKTRKPKKEAEPILTIYEIINLFRQQFADEPQLDKKLEEIKQRLEYIKETYPSLIFANKIKLIHMCEDIDVVLQRLDA